jgi:hypothetical protein
MCPVRSVTYVSGRSNQGFPTGRSPTASQKSLRKLIGSTAAPDGGLRTRLCPANCQLYHTRTRLIPRRRPLPPGKSEVFLDQNRAQILPPGIHPGQGTAIAILSISLDLNPPGLQQLCQPFLRIQPRTSSRSQRGLCVSGASMLRMRNRSELRAKVSPSTITTREPSKLSA